MFYVYIHNKQNDDALGKFYDDDDEKGQKGKLNFIDEPKKITTAEETMNEQLANTNSNDMPSSPNHAHQHTIVQLLLITVIA